MSGINELDHIRQNLHSKIRTIAIAMVRIFIPLYSKISAFGPCTSKLVNVRILSVKRTSKAE